MGIDKIRIRGAFVFVQARMGSARFPGKTLEMISKKTLLENVCHGLPKDRFVILTSQNPLDDPLEEFSQKLGFKVFRGAESNVFDRFFGAMQEYPAASYIRLTGDNPCVYKPILPELIACLKNENLDYCVSSELPLGGAAEAFTHKSFKAQALGPIGDQEQEHVTAKYYAPGSSFAWRTVPCGFSHLSGLRLTVDEREDLEMMRQLARETGQEPCELSYRKIEDLFEQNPRTFEGNRDVHQRRVSDLESQ